MWMDADAVITNFDKAAHELLDQAAPAQDLLICRDLSVPREKPTCAPVCLNTGTFILRNTEWSRRFLDRWWQSANEHPDLAFGGSHEEAALARLYSTGWEGIRDKTNVFGATAFNSAPPFLADHPADQLVLHASGEPSAVRSLVFGHIAQSLSSPAGASSTGLSLYMASLLPELSSLVRRGYEDAHAEDPNDPKVMTVLASLVRDSGEAGSLGRAGGLLKRAMEATPEDANAAVTYGAFAAQYMGEWCGARDAFMAAMRLQPGSETTAQLLRGAVEGCNKAAKKRSSKRGTVVYILAGLVVAAVMALVVCGGGDAPKAKKNK
mmetsp:Transcript_21875/g.50787  ORF Transcript_21875/g.50787 Transcript_21875/m.50787 type:complete len:322 (-) Transcript_21875:250-1215(-)